MLPSDRGAGQPSERARLSSAVSCFLHPVQVCVGIGPIAPKIFKSLDVISQAKQFCIPHPEHFKAPFVPGRSQRLLLLLG
jgi:hypothetical protein